MVLPANLSRSAIPSNSSTAPARRAGRARFSGKRPETVTITLLAYRAGRQPGRLPTPFSEANGLPAAHPRPPPNSCTLLAGAGTSSHGKNARNLGKQRHVAAFEFEACLKPSTIHAHPPFAAVPHRNHEPAIAHRLVAFPWAAAWLWNIFCVFSTSAARVVSSGSCMRYSAANTLLGRFSNA